MTGLPKVGSAAALKERTQVHLAMTILLFPAKLVQQPIERPSPMAVTASLLEGSMLAQESPDDEADQVAMAKDARWECTVVKLELEQKLIEEFVTSTVLTASGLLPTIISQNASRTASTSDTSQPMLIPSRLAADQSIPSAPAYDEVTSEHESSSVVGSNALDPDGNSVKISHTTAQSLQSKISTDESDLELTQKQQKIRRSTFWSQFRFENED